MMLNSFICNLPKFTVRLQRRSLTSSSSVFRSHRTRTHSLFGDSRSSLGAPVAATRLSYPTLFAGFHTTPRNQGSPFLVLAALLKVCKISFCFKSFLFLKLEFLFTPPPLKDFNRLRSSKDCKSNSINFHPTRLVQEPQS